jgi:pimeloyl-ACP methyl ester carboxylesterase
MASSRTMVAIAASAATLSAVALQVQANARRAEREHPPAGDFIETGGTRLHFLEAGQGGPPVVLLHGNAVQVVAFDRPGYGYSQRPRDRVWTAEAQAAVFAEAFARLGIERPIVVGHSWGTLVALALALNHLEAVGGLVLLSGYYFPTARADVPLFSPPAIPVLGDVIRYTVGPLVGHLIAPKMIQAMFAPVSVPPAFTAAVPVPMMLRPWQVRASAEDAATMIPAAAAFQERYGELSHLPVSILAGVQDMIVDVGRQSMRLHQALPASQFHVLQGLGHMVHHGAPDLVLQAVEAMALQREQAALGSAQGSVTGVTG